MKDRWGSMRGEKELILASASRRRQELLSRLGLPFKAIPSRITETVIEGETPEEHVLRLCEEKARDIGQLHPTSWVIGADTIVLSGTMILGKPRNRKEALWMLGTLAGKAHEVYTGICVMRLEDESLLKQAVKTLVHFRELSDGEMAWYVRTGEPFDKAGGYAIQGYGSVLIRGIEGSYTNVVGLPVTELLEMLREVGAWNLFAL
jgi:septum formation protein